MAVDIVPSLNGVDAPFDPDWDVAHPAYQTMVRELKAQGLAWGGDWTERDNDHFQFADVPITPTAEDRTLFAKGGLPAVWASYDDDPWPSDAPGTVLV